MIQKQELTGNALKKAGFTKANYRYHNKNNSGGNFGINLFTPGDLDNFELNGNYNREGIITGLRFGHMYELGTKLNVQNMTIDGLINALAKNLARLIEVKGQQFFVYAE